MWQQKRYLRLSSGHFVCAPHFSFLPPFNLKSCIFLFHYIQSSEMSFVIISDLLTTEPVKIFISLCPMLNILCPLLRVVFFIKLRKAHVCVGYKSENISDGSPGHRKWRDVAQGIEKYRGKKDILLPLSFWTVTNYLFALMFLSTTLLFVCVFSIDWICFWMDLNPFSIMFNARFLNEKLIEKDFSFSKRQNAQTHT